MRLENVLALTYGRLVNDPFVSVFENIVFDSKVVKRGDLFIAFDETDIEDAIFNGAYGVMFDKPTQISDTEIAWIKVTNCEESLKKLLRFELVEKDVKTYSCDEITLRLAKQIITEQKITIINGKIKSIYKQLSMIDNNSIILFCPTLSDKNIFTNIINISSNIKNKIILKEHTLFESSFIYKNIFYERQPLSPYFIPYLEKLLNFYLELNINFRLKKFNAIENFEAIFINSYFEVKEFGSTDKVILFEPNIEFLNSQKKYLKEYANWAKVIYILPYIKNTSDSKEVFFYKNKNEIIKILKNNSFNFALIIGSHKSILKLPSTKQIQLTLEF